ncbi:MAG: tripartite tricarboxylate transporter TctB family protein [Geminicoccaceae bacterium]
MQSVDGREKITVLVLLAASTMFGVLANDFGSVGEGAEQGSASNRLLFAAGLAGSLIAVLMLLSPGKARRSLGATLRAFWPQLLGLGVLVIGYALTLEPLGFVIATSLFLAIGSWLLGERRWQLLLLSIPLAAALGITLRVVFGLALHDPLMHAFGLIA